MGLLIESLDAVPGPSFTSVTALFCSLIVSFGKVYLPSKHGELLWTEFAFCIFLLYTPSWHRTYFCLRNSLGAQKEIHIYFLFQHNTIECLLCSVLVIFHPDHWTQQYTIGSWESNMRWFTSGRMGSGYLGACTLGWGRMNLSQDSYCPLCAFGQVA